MKKYFIEIANIGIEIKNDCDITKEIIKEFKAYEASKVNNVDITIESKQNLYEEYNPTVHTAKGNMNFNISSYFMGYNKDVKYLVTNMFNNKSVRISFKTSNSLDLKRILKNLYRLDFNNSKTYKNIVLSYSLFLYVLHIILLRKNLSFIHSGVFVSNNQCTVFVGTSGCGKTSTTFKILEDINSKYMADDYGIIDSNGFAYYNPKSISIYASDMEYGQKILGEYFLKLSTFEQIKWKLKRYIFKQNPMLKVPPEDVVGTRISKKHKINNVLYFVRNEDDNISIKNIDLEELCERALDATMRELKTLNEVIHLIKANAPTNYNIPSFEDIRNQTKDVYKKAFENTNNKIVYIPHKTTPDELVSFLNKQGLV